MVFETVPDCQVAEPWVRNCVPWTVAFVETKAVKVSSATAVRVRLVEKLKELKLANAIKAKHFIFMKIFYKTVADFAR